MEIKKRIILVGVILLCSLCTTNVFEQIIKGNGEVKKETRVVSTFDKIMSKGMIDVYLSQGEKESVVVETDQNVLPFIKTNVEKGVLIIKIKNGGRIRKVRKMNVYVTFKNLNNLKSKGSGDVICLTDLKLENLKIENSGSGDMTLQGETSTIGIKNSGSGDIKAILTTQSTHISNRGSGGMILKGKASESTLINSGSGDIEAFDFEVAKMTLKNSGSGDVEVNITKKFSLHNSGSGDVTYKGKASINKISVSGSGNITKKVNRIKTNK